MSAMETELPEHFTDESFISQTWEAGRRIPKHKPYHLYIESGTGIPFPITSEEIFIMQNISVVVILPETHKVGHAQS